MNILKRAKHGLLLVIYNDVYQGRLIQEYGEYCEYELLLFKKLIDSGSTVYDIGAGFGLYSLPLARHIGKSGKVFAFEPERHSFYILTANTKINQLENIFVQNYGCGKIQKTFSVQNVNTDTLDDFGSTCLYSQPAKNKSYTACIKSIDHAVFEKPDFIKISTNGMELDVLEGGKKTIKKYKPILAINAQIEENNQKIIKLLKSWKYQVYQYNSPIYNPNNWFRNTINQFMGIAKKTFICFPDNKEPEIISDFDLEKLQ